MHKTPVAAYTRMSTNYQETSIATQTKCLLELADRHNYEIVEWFSDEGRSGSRKTEKRTEWLRLIAEAPTANWKKIIVYNRSRFGRLDSFKDRGAVQRLREAGKTMHSYCEGELDWETIEGRIIDTIYTEQAAEASNILSRDTLRGRRDALANGTPVGAKCPYGMIRRLVDDKGEIHYRSRKDNFRKPKEWSQTYVPGDPQEVEVVRWIFQTFATSDVGIKWFGRELNKRFVPSPRGNCWSDGQIRAMLRNPIYVGDHIYGRDNTKGEFWYLAGNEIVKASYCKSREPAQPILLNNVHVGIIDRATWDLVQAKLQAMSAAPKRTLSRGVGGFALKGVIVCGHCGKAMYGNRIPPERRKHRHGVKYLCKTGVDFGSRIRGCAQWSVREEEVLPIIINTLANEIDMRILAGDSLQQPTDIPADVPSKIERLKKQLEELDRTIEGARERYFLAAPALMKGLESKLLEWEADRARLSEQIRKEGQKLPIVQHCIDEWQEWFRAAKNQVIEVVKNKGDEPLLFTAERFRATLRRFGCRVECFWRERGKKRYQLDKLRIMLGYTGLEQELIINPPAQSGEDQSSSAPNGAAIIDVTVHVDDLIFEEKLGHTLTIMREMRANGASYRAIAEHLNCLGLKTLKGKAWNVTYVQWALFRRKKVRSERKSVPASGYLTAEWKAAGWENEGLSTAAIAPQGVFGSGVAGVSVTIGGLAGGGSADVWVAMAVQDG